MHISLKGVCKNLESVKVCLDVSNTLLQFLDRDMHRVMGLMG